MKKNIDWSLFIPESLLEKLTYQGRVFGRIKRKDIITLEEAAVYLSCDVETVVETVEKGELPGGKLGGKWYFHKESLYKHFGKYQQEPSITDGLYHAPDEFLPTESGIVTQFLEAYKAGQRVFENLEIIGADLSNLVLSELDCQRAILANNNFSNSDLSSSSFPQSFFMNTNLSGANLSDVNLYYNDLRKADLSYSNLSGAILSDSNILGINLDSAILNGTKF